MLTRSRRRLRFVALGLAAVLGLADGPAAAAPHPSADDCAVLPRPSMRVRLTLRSDRLADAGPEIRARASDIWARQGVTLSWHQDGLDGPPSWRGVDLWVLVRHEAARLGDGRAIGAVAFDGDAPGRIATISIDAAVRLVHAEVAARFSTVERPFPDSWLGNTRGLLIPTLAVAIAHEIGHVVLASRGHAREGLMAEALVGPTTLAARPTALDATNRTRLVQRLTLAAQCPDRRVPSGARTAR